MDSRDLYQDIERTYESALAGERGFAIGAGYFDFEKNKILHSEQGRKVSNESLTIAFDNLLEGYKHAVALESMCILYQQHFSGADKVDKYLAEARRIIKLGNHSIDLFRDERRPQKGKKLWSKIFGEI